jgi:hypothetical protein
VFDLPIGSFAQHVTRGTSKEHLTYCWHNFDQAQNHKPAWVDEAYQAHLPYQVNP